MPKSCQPLCKVSYDSLVELGGIILRIIVASSEKCGTFLNKTTSKFVLN